ATVDRVRALLPQLRASIPAAIDLTVMLDRTTTIRSSIRDVELTLLVSIALVILVVFVFLRNAWATAIPGVVVPLSLIGTFGVMYLCGYSIDNLSLMALTISTGFVVDDAIVVIENITRYLEQGLTPLAAALRGSREIGFTVLSMSASLVAVFIVCINVFLYVIVPKGFFPEQDNGRLMGAVQADQDTSFQSMRQKLAEFVAIVRSDPAVDTVVALTGGSQGSTNAARMFMALKPIDERKLTAAEVMARLRPKLATVPGASLYLQ